MSSNLPNPVQMAVIGAAHGIKGELRVKTFTSDPTGLGGYGLLQDRNGRIFEVADVRPANTVVVVRFKGVTTREQAEALNGVELFIDRAALPEELDEEEFYHADLVGLAAEDEAGEALGTVIAVHDFGGGDILEIALAGQRTVLIPFTRAAVPQVDMASGKIRIDPVAAGLVDEGEAPEETSEGGGRQ